MNAKNQKNKTFSRLTENNGQLKVLYSRTGLGKSGPPPDFATPIHLHILHKLLS